MGYQYTNFKRACSVERKTHCIVESSVQWLLIWILGAVICSNFRISHSTRLHLVSRFGFKRKLYRSVDESFFLPTPPPKVQSYFKPGANCTKNGRWQELIAPLLVSLSRAKKQVRCWDGQWDRWQLDNLLNTDLVLLSHLVYLLAHHHLHDHFPLTDGQFVLERPGRARHWRDSRSRENLERKWSIFF